MATATQTGGAPVSTSAVTLPTNFPKAIRHERHDRAPNRKAVPPKHPYTLLETIRYYTGFDQELIWGPFYERFRDARIKNPKWKDFSLHSLWDVIPATAQSRPGVFKRAFNYLSGVDGTPTVAKPPKVMREEQDKETTKPRRRRQHRQHPDDEDTKKMDMEKKHVFVDSWETYTGLKNDNSPAKIDFAQWFGRWKHPADYDDEFYNLLYGTLFGKVIDLVDRFFNNSVHLEDYLDTAGEHSVWDVPMTEQFVQYTRVVACEDAGYVKWHEILSDPQHRKWLCVGIIAQIIERKIFNHVLFGASERFEADLNEHDVHWLMSEGFTRKHGRIHIVREALNHGDGLVPSCFWDSVDDLAGYSFIIFKPLFMMMCLATGKTPEEEGPKLLQELHTIMALAGYFHICTAISPDVFHILSATPGARFDWGEEQAVDTEIYERSRDFYEDHNERFRQLGKAHVAQNQAFITAATPHLKKNEIERIEKIPQNEQALRVAQHHRLRGGKVMYAVFPKLTRYRAENLGHFVDMDKPATQEEMMHQKQEGMSVVLIFRCMVVYYQGLMYPQNYYEDSVPLDHHLHNLELKHGTAFGWGPYFRRYWNGDGTVNRRLRWPVYPEHWDLFWFFWSLFTLFSLALAKQNGVGYLDQIIYDLVYAAVFVLARLFGYRWFDGRTSFLTVMLTGLYVSGFMLFSKWAFSQQDSYSQIIGNALGYIEGYLRLFTYNFADTAQDFRVFGPHSFFAWKRLARLFSISGPFPLE
ncbi:hypothetical protein F5Y18DRAFT_303948 [Xylariaceae sp. FL1019]|nr:hypothetical protein F5Y18DRAFT_303948 [Xylariaceae sp. FL1019]